MIEGVTVESVELFNAMGQVVASDRKNEVDLSSLENGVYFVRIISDNGMVNVEKVIKK